MTPEERIAHEAEKTLKKYQHYQHRFESQVDSIKKAEDTRAEKLAKNGMIAKLTAEYSSVHQKRGQFEPSNLEAYLLPALDTVIDCRRLLAWTYPIQYYMHSDKDFHREQPNGKLMFDDFQKQLEKFLDDLHELRAGLREVLSLPRARN